MANNKSLLNSSFKDTIKMTLTTDGNLGVGLINPNYKITATGVIQSKSILGYVVNDFPWKVGLDTWKDDVHLSLGVSNDGLNTGVIQVTGGDLSFNGTSFADSPYNLNLQPGGGNVGIGIQGNPGYPLHVQGQIKTNSIVRADNDFTTGTDTPGFTVQAFNTFSSPTLLADGQGPVGYNSANSKFVYKKIGKTVILHFQITGIDFIVNNNEFFYMRLPPSLFPVTPHSTSGTDNFRIETGIAWYRNSNYSESEKACQVTLRMSTAPGASYGPGTWYIQLMGMTRNNIMNPGGSASTIALSKWFADTGPGPGQAQVNSSFQGTITYGID